MKEYNKKSQKFRLACRRQDLDRKFSYTRQQVQIQSNYDEIFKDYDDDFIQQQLRQYLQTRREIEKEQEELRKIKEDEIIRLYYGKISEEKMVPQQRQDKQKGGRKHGCSYKQQNMINDSNE